MNSNLVFIVAYNHENFIEKVVARIPKEVSENPDNEILIIDDGSKDNTFFVADKINAQMGGKARLTVLKNPLNQGYGGNQKLGYRYAIEKGFERAILLHGDGQYAPEMLADIIREYSKTNKETGLKPDAVFGTRMSDFRSPLKGGMPLYKLIGNKILTIIQNFILGSKMSEFHSGYRSYSTALLKRIPFEANANDFHFDTEIIIQTLAAKGKIVEIPIPTHYGDEICHVNGMKYAKDILKACIHYRIQNLGLLYDKRFDVNFGHRDHHIRSSKNSIHSKLTDLIKNDSNVLEFSVAKNSIAANLTKKNCKVTNVELDIENVSREELTKQVRRAVESAEYDVILLADVIEHMPDPESFLEVVRSSYDFRHKKRPRVIASTGNVGFFITRFMLFFGQFNYTARGILDKTHTRLFTKKSFRETFIQSGYRLLGESGAPLPATSVFGDDSFLGRFIEGVNSVLLKIFPKFFAYQLIVEADPLPTVEQLLQSSVEYSTELRKLERA